MAYLAINMSRKEMPVYEWQGETRVKIGTIYHKERFTMVAQVPYGNYGYEIRFLSKSGWRPGVCWPEANQANDWCNYKFKLSNGDYGFKIDAPVNIYNMAKQYVTTLDAGSTVIPYSQSTAQVGDSERDWMRVKYALNRYGYSYHEVKSGMFADCKVRINSTNTPVYGSWN